MPPTSGIPMAQVVTPAPAVHAASPPRLATGTSLPIRDRRKLQFSARPGDLS